MSGRIRERRLRGRRSCRRWSFAVWRCEDGAVSLYLIVSTAAILLFTALLIDYGRIAAFNRQTELAAQTGIRSALSAYDEALYERYGLFGAGGTDRNDLFSEAADHSWPAADGSGFQLLRIKREGSHVDTEEVLGDQSVFTRQVLEEMKYKAPIDFTMEVASRFAPLGSAMKEASATIGVLEDVKQLYEERERHLARVAELQRGSAAHVSKLNNALQNASLSVSNYSAYENWRQADASVGEGEERQRANDIAAYMSQAQSGAASLKLAAGNALEDHRSDTQEALAELQKAEQNNAAIASAVERMKETEASSGFDQLANANIAGRENSSMSQEDLSQYGATRDSAAELVMEEGWFTTYRSELNEQLGQFGQIDTASASFQSTVLSSLSSTGRGAALNGAWSSLNKIVSDYSARYLSPGTVIQARQDDYARRHANDDERKSKEAAAKSKWNEVKAMLAGMSSVSGQEEWNKDFDDVKRLADDNLLFNQAASEADTDDKEADIDDNERDNDNRQQRAPMIRARKRNRP